MVKPLFKISRYNNYNDTRVQAECYVLQRKPRTITLPNYLITGTYKQTPPPPLHPPSFTLTLPE